MGAFVEVMRLEELLPGTATSVTVAGKDVALFNVDGTVYAMEDGCLHHGSSLGMGQLRGQDRHLSVARVAVRRHDRQHRARAGVWGRNVSGKGRGREDPG